MSSVRPFALVVALLAPSVVLAQRMGTNIELFGTASFVGGLTPVTVASGSHAAWHGGFRADVGLQFQQVGLGVGGRYWQMAPTDEFGGEGLDIFLVSEWRLGTSLRTTLRGTAGTGFDDFGRGHGPDRPTLTTQGFAWSVGVGHEVVVRSSTRMLLSADLLVPTPTAGAIGRRRPVLELGVGYRFHEFHAIGPL